MLGRKREEMWGVSAAPRSFPAPLCSPHLRAVTEPPPKPVLLGKKKKKKCGDLLATSPGLVRTLLAADRERTLTSAGRSHPAPQHPGLLCPAPGSQRGGAGGQPRNPPALLQGSLGGQRHAGAPEKEAGQCAHPCAES